MAEKYEVVGPAVVLPLTGGSERYLYRHAVVSDESFTAEGIEHALKIGLIAKLKSEEVEIPEGDPTDEWTVKQLKAYAGELSIDLGEAKNKPDILAVILAAK